MPRFLSSVGVLFASTLAIGCNQRTDTATAGPSDATPAAAQAPVNAVQDAASAAVGPVAAMAEATTTQGYVTAAAMGDMYEIQAADIAIARSRNPDVKAFAREMRQAHTATTAQLKATLKRMGSTVALPTALDERRKGMIDNLNSAAADQFDEAYVDQQTSAHREALTLHRAFADRGDSADLKAFAAATAPKVETHLNMVEKIDRSGADEARRGSVATH